MIVFKEKTYAEYPSTRVLYTELRGAGLLRPGAIEVIGKSQLIPILKGNNVVIEKFVISTSIFGQDKYRMYLKIGAKVNMPDKMRLTGYYKPEKFGGFTFNLTNSTGGDNNNNNNNNNQQKQEKKKKKFSEKSFGNITGSFNYHKDLEMGIHRLLGEVIKYDLKSREVILEFDSTQDAIRALNVLPFGINYKVYLLE